MSEGTRVNGPASPTGKYIDTIDPDDPDYVRNLQRPAEVKEDMKQMEGRSRVSVVLNSQAFKEELEAIIHEQIRQGGPESLFALQQISDLLLPQSRGAYSSFGRSSPVIPINDIRGVETLGYSKQEKALRCKLASCYRLVDLFGWTHGIFNHISARVSQEQEQFLVNPFGMLYSEITASTLVKVDVRGEVVDTGSTGLGISKAGFCLHSAIHQARPDIRCVIHLHTPAAVAVSATKKGLLPMSQEALICGKVSYHDYRGILVDQEERDQLSKNLGLFNKVMFLRNHGVVACGETIEEAFHYAFNVMAACDAQVRAMPAGLENLVLIDEDTQERTFKVGSQGGGGTDMSGRKWRCGELEFETLMRSLDNSGYRTGHVYKQPLMKQEKKERINSDVEVPPASSSFTYIFDGDYEHSKYISPIKLAMERQKQAYKTGWLTSPNTYKKQEIEEIGTTTPKKITKWVSDGEAREQKSTAIKVESPNQFAPQGSNPKEFKEKQKSIRKDYYEEKVTAGPQSKILDGISAWDEAARTKDGEQTVVVGAASKGIIQRDHQHNAVVYRSYYAANPFENMTEEEISAYKQGLERQEQGEEPEDVPGPEGQLISSEERRQNIQRSQEDVQEDTEAKTAHAMTTDSMVSDGSVSQPESPIQPPASPTEPMAPLTAASPFSLVPSLEELGLDGLVDTLVQAVMASALSASLREKQHSPKDWDTPSQDMCHNTLSADSAPCAPVSSAAVNQSSVDAEPISDKVIETSVKTTAQKIDVPMNRTELTEAPQIMTMQLEPTKLFQGKPGNGVMRISFSIQSKVTRRKNKGPKSSWPVENVTIMQSQPKVMMVEPSGFHQPNVLQEQQNVSLDPSVNEASTASVPMSPASGQKQFKRYVHSSSRRQGLSKLTKSKKKFSRWSRRGLTHPLSPVKEEFLEDDSLEALLAQQNVHVDSDESLEDLLLMTEEYKENLVPKAQSGRSQVPSSSSADRAAPIATIEELDENGCPSAAPPCKEKSQEEPVFIVPKVALNCPPPGSGVQCAFTSVHPSPPAQLGGEQLFSGDQTNTVISKTFQSDVKSTDTDDELKFADEEMSSTFPEASDGDIAPRKHEEGVGVPGLLHPASDSMKSVPEEKTMERTNVVLAGAAPGIREVCVEEESTVHEKADQYDVSSHGKDQPEPDYDDTERADGQVLKTDFIKTSSPVTDSGPDTDTAPKLQTDPLICAPLAAQEEDFSDAPSTAIASAEEEKSKTPLYRSDSASLENSPIVSSPYNSFPPDPIYRELHRVRSLEDELDEPNSVQRRLNKGHAAVRRVQSVGPALDGNANKNRNVAVIDAVLHTVTIDPAKIAQSGQSVATYLSGASDQPPPSDDQKKKWSLIDSVSKSLEALDVKDLARDGSMIYGRSLEIVIQDGKIPQKSAKTSLPSDDKSQTSETVVDNSAEKENVAKKGTQLYQDDVVVITKTPMDFSAISPQMKKDLMEEEGPLVTSSPKLGRRKEGSFKKYQSKMGKSEETLLEVAPLSPEHSHPTARRSTSFPKNYGLVKNRSRETLLDDHPSLHKSDREREVKTSSQSVDEVSDRNRRRTKSRQSRNSDPTSSHRAQDTHSQSVDLYTNSLGRRKSEEIYMKDIPFTARSTDSIGQTDMNREEKDESRRRRRKHQSPEIDREQSRRRMGQEKEYTKDKERGLEGRRVKSQSPDRDRGMRRGQEKENINEEEKGLADHPATLSSSGRERRRRRRGHEESNRDYEEASLEDRPDTGQSTGRERRRRRKQREGETGDKETAVVEDYGSESSRRERRRGDRGKENIVDTERGLEETSHSLGREKRRRGHDEEKAESEEAGWKDQLVTEKGSEKERRRRGHDEESAKGKEAGWKDQLVTEKGSEKERRRRGGHDEESAKGKEAGWKDQLVTEKGSEKERRRRGGHDEESAKGKEAGWKDQLVTEKGSEKERRRKGHDGEGAKGKEVDLEDHPVTEKGSEKERRRRHDEESAKGKEVDLEDHIVTEKGSKIERERRGHGKENADNWDAGVEDPLVTAHSSRRDRRRHRSDIEEISDAPKDEAANVRQNQVESSIGDVDKHKPTEREAQAFERVSATVSPEMEVQDTEDFPPPPDDLDDFEEQEAVAVDHVHDANWQDEDAGLPAYPEKESSFSDDGEENRPPRVRRPKAETKPAELTSTNSRTPETEGNSAGEAELRKARHSGKPGKELTGGDPFLSSFRQPDRKSQTLGEDFPSLFAKSRSAQLASVDKEERNPEKGKTAEDSIVGGLNRPIEPEGTVPIAGNLEILDYSDEITQDIDQHQHTHKEDEKPKTSRARERAERRRRGRSSDDKDRADVSSSKGRRGSRDSHISQEDVLSEENLTSRGVRRGSSRDSLSHQDSLDSRDLHELKGRRGSKESERSRTRKENRSSRDSLASKDVTDARMQSRRESKDSNSVSLDIMSFDQEPPRARRDRLQQDGSTGNMNKGGIEDEKTEKSRSEGRIRGRRSGHSEGHPQNDRTRRSTRADEEDRHVPQIRVQTASRETLDSEDFAPPLPPKQHRSMERLSELGRQSRKSGSREILDTLDSQEAPPELPPKKNKKTLSCVNAHDTEETVPSRKEKSKDRSSSQERKRMPPPPAPPVSEQHYNEEPRRRRGQRDPNHLRVPAESYRRERSSDASYENDKKLRRSQKQRDTDSSFPDYGDAEEELRGTERHQGRKEKNRPSHEDTTVSPPQTPRPARKISTSSYGSASARIARSVSFDDGYTPTMSHSPQHNKSRESLGSEASFHSTGYRPRSYSGASETSLASNPLIYEPWRAKAAAQRQRAKSPNSRSQRSRSQGEPTYSANAGRRRRSRTPSAGDSNRLYQPRRTRSRTSLPDAPSRSAASSGHNKSHDTSVIGDDSFSDAYSHGYASESVQPAPVRHSEPDRQRQKTRQREGDGDRPGYHTRPDHLDSASGGETLEERSSKEGSPTKEAPSPTKDKKKKKKFHMPSFSKKKKDSKESTL